MTHTFDSEEIGRELLELTRFRRRVIQENSFSAMLTARDNGGKPALSMRDLDRATTEFMHKIGPGLTLYFLASIDAYGLVPSERLIKGIPVAVTEGEEEGYFHNGKFAWEREEEETARHFKETEPD